MLSLKNRDLVIAKELIVADTFMQRFIGLMGKRPLASHEALLIDPCSQVHTMFVFFPLDILFLDNNNKILHTINSLKPFKVSPRVKDAVRVVELQEGKINKLGINCGDQIKLKR